ASSCSDVLGWLEFVLKHRRCPNHLADKLDAIMARCHLAYRVFDGQVICPMGSEAERQTIERAFADVAATQFHGARAHLRKAAELTAGRYAESIRESIHAVEATARVLSLGAKGLNSALDRLESKLKIHRDLKHGFGKLYGYTCEEQGVRHPLIDDGTANVDET